MLKNKGRVGFLFNVDEQFGVQTKDGQSWGGQLWIKILFTSWEIFYSSLCIRNCIFSGYKLHVF